jgi:two-component system, NarL family, nitrate/nitrite response regulator NarL
MAAPRTPAYRGAMPGPRILLVDDHTEFRTSATALLTVEGFRVVASVASGEEALAVIDELEFDLVLMDLYLPGLDGVEVAQVLAGRDRPPAVILISSQVDAATEPRVADAPVLGFLAKADLACASIRRLLG